MSNHEIKFQLRWKGQGLEYHPPVCSTADFLVSRINDIVKCQAKLQEMANGITVTGGGVFQLDKISSTAMYYHRALIRVRFELDRLTNTDQLEDKRTRKDVHTKPLRQGT